MASEPGAPLVGVLALQGDFADHEAALQAAGLRTRQVRTAADLRGLHGLVLPGGESTTMLKLLD
ncbi:MAG: pyridoxal 5'-phosphate synthase glutaminase subunit PdxT, partial [Phycisphaerae bacterium]